MAFRLLNGDACVAARHGDAYTSVVQIDHQYPFDPTYGYTLERMLALAPPTTPEDFDLFWQATYEETLATPLQLEVSEQDSPWPGFRLREVHFASFGDVRIGGWLVTPLDGEIERYEVVGHGYHNRTLLDCIPQPNRASMFYGCRGLGISRVEGIPDETMAHVVHGIDHRNTYVHRGCVADTWAAASALLEVYPIAISQLDYRGDSFGGGIGAMALAWDHRFRFASIGVPSFGNMPLRVTLKCTGSGEAVRRRYRHDPRVLEVLAYYDAAVHASRIACPTHVMCALFDPAVPPPGQVSVYNAILVEKQLFIEQSGHHETPQSAADRLARAADVEAFRGSLV